VIYNAYKVQASIFALNTISKEGKMKQIAIFFAVIAVIFSAGCAQTTNKAETTKPVAAEYKDVQEKQLYTAYNIWRMRPHSMKCINYKYGHDLLPAGTKVRNVDIRWDSRTSRNTITFKSEADNRVYNIYFTKNWHPGKSIEDYKNLMFTIKSLEELTEGMNETEVRAIKDGIIVDGMSKNAVLVAYGYPPEHRTGSLFSDRWIYWRNKYVTFAICFDKNEKTVSCR
jgi:hypothetical protein